MDSYFKNNILLLITAVFLISCGGGGGGGGGSSSDGSVTPIGDVAGSWSIDEKLATTDCKGDDVPGSQFTNIYKLTQNGDVVSLVSNGHTYSGKISGNKITGSASYPENGGTTSANLEAIVADSCDALTGTITWSWAGAGETCNGTTSLKGTRSPAKGCGSTSTTVPSAATNFGATATSDTTIRLSWSDVSDNEKGFKIYRSTTSGVFNSTPIATTGSGVTFFNDTGLMSDTLYYYRIYAFNDAGQSTGTVDKSARTKLPAGAIPDTPTATNLVNSSTRITVMWNNVANESGYHLESKLSTDTTWRRFNVAANVSSTSIAGLTPNSTYNFRVRAYNSAGNSAYSYTNGTTLNASSIAPQLLRPPSSRNGVVNLTWTFDWNAGGSSTNTGDGYELQEKAPGQTTFFTIYNTLNMADRVSPKMFNDKKTSSGSYTYRVRARKNGIFSPWSASQTVSVMVSSTGSTLKISNNLSGNGSDVLQLRLAPTVAMAKSDANETLSPDGACIYLGPKSIIAGSSKTYTVNSTLATSGYSVFIGLGLIDDSLCLGNKYFQKKMYTNTINGNLYIYQTVALPSGLTNQKNVDLRLRYSGSKIIIAVYVDNVHNTNIDMVGGYTDPTTP